MTRILTTESDVYDRMSESLNSYNNIKYMPYRIALKLAVLQKFTSRKCPFLYVPTTAVACDCFIHRTQTKTNVFNTYILTYNILVHGLIYTKVCCNCMLSIVST